MKHFSIVAIITAFATLGTAAIARADVTLLDNNKTVAVDCAKDPEVNLVGNHLTVTTKGICARITVSGNEETVTGSASIVQVNGNHNTVTLDAADDVAINGNRNTVIVRKPIKAKAPRISNPGTDNHVTRPK
jgi:catabolite regulation protein CreA